MSPLPPLVAHRFGRAYGPDSSQRALSRSLAAGIGGVETDCCLTRDDRLVLVHDPLLDRATTLTGWVRDHSLENILKAELRCANGQPSGIAPLSFEEGLTLLSSHDFLVQLEVKSYADEDLALRTTDAVCDALEQSTERPRNVEIISFWPASCARAAMRGFKTRLIIACPYTPKAFARWATNQSVSGVILEGAYFAVEPVREWRDAGISVMSGVINHPDHLRRVLSFSPDLVATDRPAELRAEVFADA